MGGLSRKFSSKVFEFLNNSRFFFAISNLMNSLKNFKFFTLFSTKIIKTLRTFYNLIFVSFWKWHSEKLFEAFKTFFKCLKKGESR